MCEPDSLSTPVPSSCTGGARWAGGRGPCSTRARTALLPPPPGASRWLSRPQTQTPPPARTAWPHLATRHRLALRPARLYLITSRSYNQAPSWLPPSPQQRQPAQAVVPAPSPSEAAHGTVPPLPRCAAPLTQASRASASPRARTALRAPSSSRSLCPTPPAHSRLVTFTKQPS